MALSLNDIYFTSVCTMMLSLNNVSITCVCNMMIKKKREKKWCTFYLCLDHDASLLPQIRDDVSDIDVKTT